MSVSLLVTLAAVFISTALVVGSTLSAVLTASTSERKRLMAVTRAQRPVTVLPEVSLRAQRPQGAWQTISGLMPKSAKELTRLRVKMVRAGFKHPSAPIVHTVAEFVGPIIAGGVALVFLEPPIAWFAAAIAAIGAFFIPGIVVERRLAKQRKQLENGLPDALDLLVVCIEAGSGIDQAIIKTADELTIAYPALAEELRILNMEVRAGKPRIEAFKNLASRTKVDEIRALVAMLIQTDRFGTSVGQALRTHAEVSRTKRRQRAEERAQKIGVKLVFPLVLFFFPAFYVVVLGPAVIQFMHGFMNK